MYSHLLSISLVRISIQGVRFFSNFWNNAIVLYCHSKFHYMSLMSQSSIKVTSMTHVNSFGIKMKSEGTSKWYLIMILW